MFRQLPVLSATLAVVLTLGSLGSNAQPPKANPQKDDQQSVDSKAQKRALASSIQFSKELGLPYKSLTTLGSRIDTARRGHDPVSLAHAANELAVAEKVSGKKASLTSAAVLKESAELAKLRRQVAELQAVKHVADQVTTETTILTGLQTSIADAQKVAQDETNAIRRNEEPTDAPRKVLVNNYTTQYVDIWVNGDMKLTLDPGQSKWFVIEHKFNPTVLEAYGNDDGSHWGPRNVWGAFKTYTWNLN